MYEPIFTKKFEKDIKKCQKRGLEMEELKAVMSLIINAEPLENRHKLHQLIGNYVGYLECHIRPDWLLIYKLDDKENSVTFARTGTHADLF